MKDRKKKEKKGYKEGEWRDMERRKYEGMIEKC